MTGYEIRKLTERLFQRPPYAPVAYVLTSGKRVVVDKQNEVNYGPEDLTITRRGVPEPTTVRYADIERVATLDELPGQNGALGYAEFYAAVVPLLRREPFEPFTLEFVSGKRLLVESRNQFLMAGRSGVYIPKDAAMIPLDLDRVARVLAGTPTAVVGS
jgi:hypothetical protein